ncbi:hypothetical protein ACFQ9X_51980 [Catenulispora yoronensis]
MDDAADAEHVRPLLPGTGGCAVLITSRNRAFGLPGTEVRLLDCLSAQEAELLLGALIGAERAQAEPQALAELAGECGRLPLALRIAGARLAARPPGRWRRWRSGWPTSAGRCGCCGPAGSRWRRRSR